MPEWLFSQAESGLTGHYGKNIIRRTQNTGMQHPPRRMRKASAWELDVYKRQTINQRLKVEGTFDAFMWGVATYTSKVDYLLRHMDGIDTPPTLAICRWQNQEYTDLLNKGVAEKDPVKEQEYTDEAQKLLYEHYPVIPLYQQQDTYVMVKELKGVRDGTYQVPLLKRAYFE